jgi:SAM-dependent methyltransferase
MMKLYYCRRAPDAVELSVKPDPEKVRFWETRAAAYDRLCRQWEIFSLLSNRLVDLLPADLHGPVLDVGAGSGLTSELLLARHPRCEAILIEPSQAMLDLARRNLVGHRAQFLPMGLDRAAVRDLHAIAAVASASMQFVDLDPAFGALAKMVEPGGHVAFNLWYHHWEETADLQCMRASDAIIEAACLDAKLPLPPRNASSPKPKTRSELTSASRTHGFRLVAEQRDEDSTPLAFGVDFDAMSPDWPVKALAPDVRQAVLTKMYDFAHGQFENLVSTRFLFERTSMSR